MLDDTTLLEMASAAAADWLRSAEAVFFTFPSQWAATAEGSVVQYGFRQIHANALKKSLHF